MTSGPNFLVILTDDQGAWTRTAPEIITPEVDALAARGRELTSFYCVSPVCSPARASILTGLTPSEHGVHDWIRCENSGIDTRGVHYLQGLTTTPEVLAEAGYACAHSGKWHLGDARTPAPGFGDWYTHRDGGGPYFSAPVIEEGVEKTEPGYITEAITDHALAMLDDLAAGEAPFYLQVAYTAPHSPWDEANHPAELRALYDGCDFPSIPRDPVHPWMDRGYPELMVFFDDPIPPLTGYCAALTGADRGVGALLARLDARGIGSETYVIFHSDNGFACGHHGFWGKGNGTDPLNAWEPSVKVPFVVAGPGIEPGRDDDPASALALHATILDLAGVADPSANPERSLAQRLRGEAVDAEPAVVYDEYGGLRMIRSGNAKLILRHSGPDELYLLDSDPGEVDNRIDDPSLAELVRELSEQLREWFARHSVPERDAFSAPVSGYGQDHPVWAGYPVAERYVRRPGNR